MSADDEKREVAAKLFDDAVALFDSGDAGKAAVIFERLLVEFPEVCNIGGLHHWLGSCHNQLDSSKEAITHLRQALVLLDPQEFGPSIMNAYDLLGACYWNIGNLPEALKCLEAAEEYFHFYDVSENYQLRYEYRRLKGHILHKLGESDKALKEYRLARSYISEEDAGRSVKEAETAFLIGKIEYHSSGYEGPTDWLISLDVSALPQNHHREYHLLMQRVLLELRKYSDALVHFNALELLGIPDQWMAEVLHYAGRTYYHLGDKANARKCFEDSRKHPAGQVWLEESNCDFLNKLNEVER